MVGMSVKFKRGGGYFGFQVTGMIEWGQKSKPKTIPRASNKTTKYPMPNICAIKISRKH